MAVIEAEVVTGGPLPRFAYPPQNLKSEAHFNLQEEMAQVEERQERLRVCLDGWDDMNPTLAELLPPPEVMAAWAVLGIWLETSAGLTNLHKRLLEDQENDLLF